VRILDDLGRHQGLRILDQAHASRIVVGAAEVEDTADDRPAEERRPRAILVRPVEVYPINWTIGGPGEEWNSRSALALIIKKISQAGILTSLFLSVIF